MQDKYKHARATYLLTIVACLVIIAVCLTASRQIIYAPVASLILTVLEFFSAVMIIMMGLVVRTMRHEARDWSRTCEPLLQRYEQSHDVDELVGGYEHWRLGQHTSAIRYELLERVCSVLTRDGYEADARVALSGLAHMAETDRSRQRFHAFRERCLAEFERQEEAYEAEERERAARADAAAAAAREAEAAASRRAGGPDVSEDELRADAAAQAMASLDDLDEPDEGGDARDAGPANAPSGDSDAADGNDAPRSASQAAAPAPSPDSTMEMLRNAGISLDDVQHAPSAGRGDDDGGPQEAEADSTVAMLRDAGMEPGSWDPSYRGKRIHTS